MSEPEAPQPHVDPSDRELIEAFLAGDSEAIEQVRSWARSQLRRLVHDPSVSEDLEQDVLVDLLETLEADRFRGESRFETFVRTFCRFKSIDRIRLASKRELVPIVDEELTDHRPGPADLAGRRAEVEIARKVVRAMAQECRELWTMIHDGLSYSEMSRLLSISEGALRVRVHRCRQKAAKLRERLQLQVRGGS